MRCRNKWELSATTASSLSGQASWYLIQYRPTKGIGKDTMGEQIFDEPFGDTLQTPWQWLQEDPAAWKLQDGRLYLRRYKGNGFYADNNHRLPILYYPNVELRDGMSVQVKTGYDVDKSAGQGGIMLWYDDGNYAKLVLEYWWEKGIHVIFLKEENDVPRHEKEVDEKDLFWGGQSVELRLTYRQGKFITECREIGGEWQPHFTVDAIPNRGPINVGLFSQADAEAHDWMWFDDFKLTMPAGAEGGR